MIYRLLGFLDWFPNEARKYPSVWLWIWVARFKTWRVLVSLPDWSWGEAWRESVRMYHVRRGIKS